MSDYISRADAIGAVQDHFNDDGFKGYDDGQKMMDRITALPSANIIEFDFTKHQPRVRNKVNDSLPSADRPTGEWIFDTQIPIGDGRTSAGYRCSNCHKDYWNPTDFNYCPNCGTRMETKK